MGGGDLTIDRSSRLETENSLPPVVAIVGRPNVGKSTLFNRLIGRRQSIVHDQPGVTRDRIVAEADFDRGPVTLIDTGGLVPGEDELGLNAQVDLAVEESDALVLVVDGKDGLTVADETVWRHLRRSGRPTVLAINKADTRAARQNAVEFARLGIDHVVEVSAEHALGVGDLEEVVAKLLPEEKAQTERAEGLPVAVVGRPNVGKSSIVNRLLGSERVLVSPVAGTTRDPVDTLLSFAGRDYQLIDTAGIRRRAKVLGTPEDLAVMMARRQIERCEVAVLVIDGSEGVVSGDLAIAGAIWQLGRSAVVAINKWDLVTEVAAEQLSLSYPRLEQILGLPEHVNLSALTGRGVARLLPAVARVSDRSRVKLATSDVNRLFETAVARHHPPAAGDRPWKMYYATQVNTAPPTYMVFANRKLPHNSSYRRYLENFVRQELDLAGVPVRLVIRRK